MQLDQNLKIRLPWRRLGSGAASLVCLFGLGLILPGADAGAAIAPSLHAPGNCEEIVPAPGSLVYKCDDGVPGSGGTTPNLTGESAITVPAAYGGDGYTGLPSKARNAATVPGANPAGEIGLDVNLTLPSTPPPAGGYPILLLGHGCCGGSKVSWESDTIDASRGAWHYNSSWFAARGYLTVTLTSRGFVNGDNHGSNGEAQLQSRLAEINDYQSLFCQITGSASEFSDVNGQRVSINPKAAVVTGGSYGAAFSWMALTDPKWSCTDETGAGGTSMKLAAVAPKYGWTDIAYALVPNGHHSSDRNDLPATNGCDTGPLDLDGNPCPGGGTPNGTPKSTIVAGLYASGKTGIPPGSAHTTFPLFIDEAFVCLQAAYPPTPLCQNTIAQTLPALMRDRSAYYQNDFFRNVKEDPSYRIPIFNAATNTDPLFPPVENRRMTNRLLKVVPSYPIQTYHGDYQHFTQDKAKEWGDLCGADHHVCVAADYPGGDYNADPPSLVRTGVTSRLNDFIDHYARPSSDRNAPKPKFDVTASLQICPDNASAAFPADEPGQQFTARNYDALHKRWFDLDLDGNQTTTSTASPNLHAINADPVGNSQTNGGRCPTETGPAGPGVATYESDPLEGRKTMIGPTSALVHFNPVTNSAVQINARLYDVLPGGKAVLVDRGTRVFSDQEASQGWVEVELYANAWRFPVGHRIRIELAQDDNPHIKNSSLPSTLALSGVELRIPIRELEEGPCANKISGNELDERLSGSKAGDLLKARRGRDRVIGRRGSDCLNGGPGQDVVSGSKGRDKVTGGSGDDKVRGGKSADRLTGGRGDDLMLGGAGNDTIKAEDGAGGDVINCGGGIDIALVDRGDKVSNCEKVRRR